MEVKGIIFDLDGTLIESPGMIRLNGILKDTLKEFYVDNIDESLISEFWSSGRNHKNILEKLGVKSPDLFWRSFDEKDYNLRRDLIEKGGMKAYSDVNTLVELSRKYKLGLVSNSSEKVVKLELGAFKLRRFFQSIIILGSKLQNYAKPEPQGLVWCMEKLGLRKNEVIYIGDLEIDLEAGRSAGVKSIRMMRKAEASGGKGEETIRNLYELINNIL